MAATVYNTIQRLPRLAAVSRQRYAALLAVEIMRILLQGSKQAISLKLRHPQRLSPLSRLGQTLKLCFSREKKEAFGSCARYSPAEKWVCCRNNGIGCRCFVGLQLAIDHDHDGMQGIHFFVRDDMAHSSSLAKREFKVKDVNKFT